ncbi:hypothetical protein LTR17_007015 [Elasticomyces elasticus]|nr:hypothetical protein LTR17_007015 [Elasticomyces elasticus]
MAKMDSNALLVKLMAAALTWTGRAAQADRDLVGQLYTVVQAEGTAAGEEIARLKALLAKADKERPSQNAGLKAAENEISRLEAKLAKAEQEEGAIQELIRSYTSKQSNAAAFAPSSEVSHRSISHVHNEEGKQFV